MIYIIDGNNVAGKLKMLSKDNFDKKLIELIRVYNQNRNSPILLVFDGCEQMGDKAAIDPLFTVRYSPKDGYYESADDLIVEIVEKNLNRKKEEITIITDDIALKKRIEKARERFGGNIIFQQATRFAEKLIALKVEADTKEDGERGLNKDEQAEINKDLLKLWQ
ncbi:NYN domain-containing protein [Candidatus Parcubacteria bacterium]|nr:NYN domain-containing protein [Candidatus Parcubacteria bacterium]